MVVEVVSEPAMISREDSAGSDSGGNRGDGSGEE